jgi:hypothetical protein
MGQSVREGLASADGSADGGPGRRSDTQPRLAHLYGGSGSRHGKPTHQIGQYRCGPSRPGKPVG